ncbi:cupin domain-containing protein [Mycobacterium paraense]|uniref:cupin domain-containing protein n=1 Tax=Mycobacterium paraense TaxID=767916 RepID=UPI001F4D8107|nr:cupin domain-containing protein [Mycobacterium paraense]
MEVFGPVVQFMTPPDDDQFCVMRAVIPPGVVVPLHSHADFEDFYILAGSHQVLVEGGGGLEWRDARSGDYVRVPGDVQHAHRNVAAEPAVDLIITTARMGRFFREVGRPVGSPPPTPKRWHGSSRSRDATATGWRRRTKTRRSVSTCPCSRDDRKPV